MKNWRSNVYFVVFLLTLCAAFSCQSDVPKELRSAFNNIEHPVDFNFDIRPILADRCYSCHGPDDHTRKANLRLDNEEGAFSPLKNSNNRAFVPGNLSRSAAWKRIISSDPGVMMPPPEAHLSLSVREKAMMAKWINQGAIWKEHWAFIPPVRSPVPEDLPVDWSRINPIDNFIQAKLLDRGLSPSTPADKQRLIRRLAFDLTGLPPSLKEIESFVNDESADAYEDLVDRLLISPSCAERLTMEWMDVARYADSHGMHADGLRIMWPWRDWVIDAFGRNLPYNEFVSWQLAGDLLANASLEQKLATGFLRNQPLNSESGIVPEEYRLKYVADRTNTTATAFLGLTMECASCHDHKFDPISQKEYYQMSAFFNNVKELGMIGNDMNFGPLLLLTDSTTDQKLKILTDSIGTLETKKSTLKVDIKDVEKYLSKIKSAQPLVKSGLNSYNSASGQVTGVEGPATISVSGNPEIAEGRMESAIRLTSDYDQINIRGLDHFNLDDEFSFSAWIKTEKTGSFQSIIGNIGDKNSGWRGWLFFMDTLNRPGLYLVNNLSQNYLHVVGKESVEAGEWTHISFTYDGSAHALGVRIFMDGKALHLDILGDRLYKNILPVKSRNYQPDPQRSVRLGRGSKYLFSETDDGVFYGAIDEVRLYDKCLTGVEILGLRGGSLPNLDTQDGAYLKEYFLKYLDSEAKLIDDTLKSLRRRKFALLDPIQEVMVLEEMATPRKTHVLNRGQYDDLGEEVRANTPGRIFPFADSLIKNRLGLTEWLFAVENPLTARVTVNRYWQMIFGRGIVSTPHDFGVQGSLPTHPELLDWLAVDFRESGWNLRQLLKMMVMSATYRQSSMVSDSLEDHKNIWLSRGPNYRLPLEMIRDNALASSGLLVRDIGGESVKPYQPEGLWKEKNEFSGFLITYQHDQGDNLYRRSMYTFIRRTSPPPIMTIFDAPTRDVCTVKREVTNTPLQALVLLNDPQFLEAARILAERIQYEGGETIRQQIDYAFQLVCGRIPKEKESKLLMKQYDSESLKFKSDEVATKQILKIGEKISDPNLRPVQTAALAMVCNTILNFDEAYMKR